MSVDFDDQVRSVATAIRVYLKEHPQAKDTRAGIRAWWLPNELRNVPEEVLDAALQQLLGYTLVKFTSTRAGMVVESDSDSLISSTGKFSASGPD